MMLSPSKIKTCSKRIFFCFEIDRLERTTFRTEPNNLNSEPATDIYIYFFKKKQKPVTLGL